MTVSQKASGKSPQAIVHPSRRQFGQAVLGGVLGGSIMLSPPGCAGAEPPATGERPPEAIKLAMQLGAEPSAEDLLLVKQLGVQYVTLWVSGRQATLENFRRLKEACEAAGLKVWNIGNWSVHNMPAVTLNLPDRDKKTEEYLDYLRKIHKVGLRYTTYAHMANSVWSTRSAPIRGASGRVFDLAQATDEAWLRQRFGGPLTHGRRYTEKEIWDNYTYFIKRVVPVAEQLDIRIGIHPDDPPGPELGGVPRCIFSSFEGYRRALEIADSKQIGLCLCVGCWLEGGPRMGRDVLETIRYFGRRGRIFKVHFRNVRAPLPHFTETFLDNGYMDMYQVMKALREVNFDGAIIPDHVPRTVGGRRVGDAYSIGYMRALLERAEQKV
jgi:mannonate dehydratase